VTDARPDPLTGTALDGRYVIERRLARGGMSTVYVARDAKLRRLVAVKVLYPHLAEDPSFVRRFESEAITAAKLSHPHVVSVYDQGVDGETAYLVLEYVPGATLHDVLRTQGALSPRAALQVTDAVLSGLAAAHDAGLVHRDIKPQNVLLAPDGRIKVADFGLARAATAHTATAALIGTAAYLSPELVEGKPADTRTDLYAVGIMLYEMLTGEVPFTGETTWQVAVQHLSSSVPAPSELVPGLAQEFDELVRWCTEKDPEARPHDATAMLQDLRHIRWELTDEQLDLGEEPTSLSALLASTLAVLGRAAQAPSTLPDAAGSGAARTPGGPGSQDSGAGGPGSSEAATTVIGSGAADQDGFSGRSDQAESSEQDEDDPDNVRTQAIDGRSYADHDHAPDSDTAATTVLGPGAGAPGAGVRGAGVAGAGALGSEALRAEAQDTEAGDAAAHDAGHDGIDEADAEHGDARTAGTGDDRRWGADREDATTVMSRPGDDATRPLARTDLVGSSQQRGDIPPTVPRLPSDTAPVQPPAEGSRRGRSRAAKAAAKQARKDAQRPTVSLTREGTARRAWIWVVLVVILAAALGTGAWFFGAGPGAKVLIPDLAGSSEAQATADLSAQGISVSTKQVYDEKISAGKVVGTDPPAGQSIRKFQSLSLLVSQGPRLYDVPNVVGLTRAAATDALKKAHLAVGKVSQEYDESMPKGQVLHQGTDAGKQLRSDTGVDLAISRGPAPVAVPDLSGRSPEDAETLLTTAGLKAKQGDDVFSDTVDKGQVATQDTDSGKKIERGSTVTFHVSKGPEMVDVPNTVGKNPDDAKALLEQAGFTVKVEEGSFGVIFNRVATQSPAGGTARKGSTVTIGVY